ncbi:MAG: ComEC/Rec2 family competence protein [Clostridia bacterium]|nr:ComEC/Rec2 family competence protein [Clostridia bacterium]
MRRPLAISGFSLALSNLLCVLWGNAFAGIAGGVTLSLLILLFFTSANNSRLVHSLCGCCLFFLCGCFCFLIQYQIQIQPLLPLDHTTKYIEYTVIEEEGTYDEIAYYTVSAKNLYPDKEKECNIRLSMAYPHRVSVGDRAGGIVTFSVSDSAKLSADRIYLTARSQPDVAPTHMGQTHGFSYYAHKARTFITTLFTQTGTNTSTPLLTGICLGNARDMTIEQQTDFYACGLGHLVAVSGLHTNQVGSFFIVLFLMLFQRRRWVKLGSLVFVWGFVLLTGLSFSALRAAIMFTFFAVGSCFFRKMDPLNTLGGAVTAILLCNPFAVGNIGFLASVSACLGLILLASPLEQKLHSLLPMVFQRNKVLSYVIKGLCTTLSALIATIPCNLLSFHSFTLVAPLSNILCVPLGTMALILGLFGTVFSLIPPLSLVGTLCLWTAHRLVTLIIHIAHWLAKIPFGTLPQATPITFFAILLCGGGILWLVLHPHKLKPVVKFLIVILLCCGVLCSSLLPAYPQDTEEICIVANEYDAAVVFLSKDTAILIGGCSMHEMNKILSSRGVSKLNLWVLPNRANYSIALTQLPQQFKVDKIMTFPYADTLGLFSAMKQEIPLHFSNSLTVGSISVTAEENFKSFTVETKNTSLFYGDTVWTEHPPQDFAFFNQKSEYADRHVLQNEKEYYPIVQTTTIRISPDRHRIYQPNFLF